MRPRSKAFCSNTDLIWSGPGALSGLTLSLPNATVVEFTVHCQIYSRNLKAQLIAVYFLTVLRDANLCFYFKLFRGHNNIVYGRIRNFLYKN